VIRGDGPVPRGRAWVRLGADSGGAAQFGGKLLRLVSESRARNDPGLRQLGPDPLGPGFDPAAAAGHLLSAGSGRELGDALLDQRIVAGIGNAIRTEACFAARVSPWRPVDELSADEAERVIRASHRVMRVAVDRGRRPRSIYRAVGRPCPRCGTLIRSRGQGDANRIAYWCPTCQR
jgi:endonuclease-8